MAGSEAGCPPPGRGRNGGSVPPPARGPGSCRPLHPGSLPIPSCSQALSLSAAAATRSRGPAALRSAPPPRGAPSRQVPGGALCSRIAGRQPRRSPAPGRHPARHPRYLLAALQVLHLLQGLLRLPPQLALLQAQSLHQLPGFLELLHEELPLLPLAALEALQLLTALAQHLVALADGVWRPRRGAAESARDPAAPPRAPATAAASSPSAAPDPNAAPRTDSP